MHRPPARSVILVILAIAACGGGASPAPANTAPMRGTPSAGTWERGTVDDAVAGLPHVTSGWIASASGARTYVLEAGPIDRTAPPLVLVHGLGERGVADFYPVLSGLCRTRRVIAIDLPGLGRSELGTDTPTPRVFVERVREAVAARAPRGFDLLGHSLGGVVALLLAADHPSWVRRLVLVDVAGVLHREAFVGSGLRQGLDPVHRTALRAGQLLEGAGKAMLSALRAVEPSDDALRSGARALGGPLTQAALGLIELDVGPAFERITAPALLLWGERDPIAPLRTAQVLRSRLAAVRLVTLPQVGHVPMTESTDAFVREVNGFLEANSPTPLTAPSSVLAAPNEPGDHRCEKQHDVVITGRFRELRLSQCRRVVLRDVHASRIVSDQSDGTIEASTVTAGFFAYGSDWTVTAGTFAGEVALTVASSRVDLAGTRLHGTRAAMQALAPSRVLMSVVDLRSPYTRRSGHGHAQLARGQGF